MNKYIIGLITADYLKKSVFHAIIITALLFIPLKKQLAQDTYRVAHGNTLYSIALIHNVTVNELKTWNNLTDDIIYTGQILKVSSQAATIEQPSEKAIVSPDEKDVKHKAIEADSPIGAYSFQITELEIKFDKYLENVLSRYFDPKSFKVDVRLDLHKSIKPLHKSTINLPLDDVVLPGMPFMPEEIIRKQRQQTTILFQEDFKSPLFKLKEIRINIYADVSYTREDFEFMKEIMDIAAKLNKARGDTVSIISTVFPQPITESNNEDIEQAKFLNAYNTSIFSLPFYFVIISTILVIVLLFFVFVLLRKRL